MNIGDKLKKYRKNRGLTQEEVAKKIYVSRATISSWETNRTFPDIEKIIYLSEIYQVSLDQLLKEEPEIMENVRDERKKLKRYKILKIIGLIFLVLFIIYNIYWFISAYPKNQKLSSSWKKDGPHYYLKKKGEYTFQAHSLKYLEPVHNGNIEVSTSKGSNFDISIDGDYVFVGLYGPSKRSAIPDSQKIDFFGKIKKNDINNFKITMISGNLTADEASKFLRKYNKEFKKDVDKTLKVWESINK